MLDLYTIFQNNEEAMHIATKSPIMQQLYHSLDNRYVEDKWKKEEENKHAVIDLIVQLVKQRQDVIDQLIIERKQNAALIQFKYGVKDV